MKLLIFFDKGDYATQDAANALCSKLTQNGHQVNVYDRMSSDLEVLRLIVKHRIVRAPTVLIFDGDEPRARLLHLPTFETVCLFARH